jgi:type I protein arginine methyltransferase
MFCAKAGASHVFAVDKSDIIDKARENIYRNSLSESVTCIRGMIEDITLPVEKVDIIVSEWMGYCLLYEAMLHSLLVARDKFLKPDGLLVPGITSLWVAPVEDAEYVSDQITFWTDVYGFDMRAMQAGICDDVRIQTVSGKAICGTASPFLQLPLHRAKVEDLAFTAKWTFRLSRDVESIDGFLVWFDTYFTDLPGEKIPIEDSAGSWASEKTGRVAFTTGPFGKETHWKQGLLLLDSKNTCTHLARGTELTGEISYSTPPDKPRALLIEISWTGPSLSERTQSWRLW